MENNNRIRPSQRVVYNQIKHTVNTLNNLFFRRAIHSLFQFNFNNGL